MRKRDYSLFGEDAERAVATGLAAAEGHHTALPRKEMKALMTGKDQPAILWIGLMLRFAGLGIRLWPSWWSAPFRLASGVLYGPASDSRRHDWPYGARHHAMTGLLQHGTLAE